MCFLRIFISVLLILVLVLTIITLLTGDCFINIGEHYAGSVSVTKSGRSCQYWKSNFPHRIQYVLPYLCCSCVDLPLTVQQLSYLSIAKTILCLLFRKHKFFQ